MDPLLVWIVAVILFGLLVWIAGAVIISSIKSRSERRQEPRPLLGVVSPKNEDETLLGRIRRRDTEN